MSQINCRNCNNINLEHVISFQNMPLSRKLKQSKDEVEKSLDINLFICSKCFLLQNPIPPNLDDLYNSEFYSTSFQKPKHIDELINVVLNHVKPNKVLDIGCNDGSLLEKFDQVGFKECIGVEPNEHVAKISSDLGYKTYAKYMDNELGELIFSKHGKFDVIVTRHVAEHVPNLDVFFKSINELLNDDGMFVLELPDVEAGFDKNNPVIVWEEHVNYFTKEFIRDFVKKFDFEITYERDYSFGGGSVAFYLTKKKNQIYNFLTKTKYNNSYFKNYVNSLLATKKKITQLLTLSESKKIPIILYGAGPRSSTFTSFFEIGNFFNFVIDDREEIENLYLPGTKSPIKTFHNFKPNDKEALVLIAVGAENDHKIINKLNTVIPKLYVLSIFQPRVIINEIENVFKDIS